MMGGAAAVWGLLYIVLEEPMAGSIPLTYYLLSAGSIALYSRHKRYRLFRTSQLSLPGSGGTHKLGVLRARDPGRTEEI